MIPQTLTTVVLFSSLNYGTVLADTIIIYDIIYYAVLRVSIYM